jgi:deoxycytidine triphosphate deaminase
MLMTGLAVACAPGCTSYYRVTDPSTGRVYYATRMDQGYNGNVTLTDVRTGHHVTIQNSEIAKVSKEEFDAGRYTTPSEPP